MAKFRGDDELQQSRKALFESFPEAPQAKDSLTFQKRLIDEILRAEAEQKAEKSRERSDHLRAVRAPTR